MKPGASQAPSGKTMAGIEGGNSRRGTSAAIFAPSMTTA